jgi:hypothetical protein
MRLNLVSAQQALVKRTELVYGPAWGQVTLLLLQC